MEDLDVLHLRGLQLLQRFQQDVELFQRPPIIKQDGALADLVATARSPGLIAYQEAGCRKVDEDRGLVVRLNTTLCDLQEQFSKNLASLKQMQCGQEDCEKQLLDSFAPGTPCDCADDPEGASPPDEEMDVERPALEPSRGGEVPTCNHGGGSLTGSRATMGRAILTMYEKDVEMKARIINDLKLDSPSHVLQAYSIMWELRPYVSEEALEEFQSWSESAG
ncbi:hypothetical protein KFL_002280070 [Klebsormidium nitens]|uniref:DUF7795 domain-containing protein n=1 Tax=Klebsormidium nitens TaxID=105231 RepID=A0A1Y1I474_KLENI|nr:hypothetical protein KFL_002280070 [Klebsormidium nitens]|eukprot:GAQ85293.1 hypothetical protein KFL_002280070 [Klebsormidium nitens]